MLGMGLDKGWGDQEDISGRSIPLIKRKQWIKERIQHGEKVKIWESEEGNGSWSWNGELLNPIP